MSLKGLIGDLVSANHILFKEGVVDGFGHVSVREARDPERFLLSIFEIREAGGPATDMLIRDRKLGAALARTLGAASFALMRGHGSVAVGGSLKQVVFRAIYAEANARLQSDAMKLGAVTFLNEHEAANTAAANDVNLDRPWELWKKRVSRPA